MTTSYESVSSVGITPQEAVRLGYGRLLGSLHRIAEADETRNFELRQAAIGTAHDFLGALIEATRSAPPEGEAAAFAERLRALYAFWGSSLAKMAMHTDVALLGAITTQVREMARAWDAMLRDPAQGAA